VQALHECTKCEFGKDEVTYLGHVISRAGVAMDHRKVQAVLDWPLPRSVKAVRVFLGLVGYYHCFIKGYCDISTSLTALLHKDAFRWGAEADITFRALQSALTLAPVHQLPIFTEPFIIECDASGVGIGAMQHQGRGSVAFLSRQLASRHATLAAYERELIGLVLAMRHWRLYLWGHVFMIRTDHYILKFLLDQKLATIPQHQWISKLLGFDFCVEYKPGAANVVNNTLSQCDWEAAVAILALSAPTFELFNVVQRALVTDLALLSLWEEVERGACGTNWCIKDDMILIDGRIYIPAGSPLTSVVLHSAHRERHEGVTKTLHRL
jgi:hypothetical protein